ncbi:MAG: isoleucine--tRNA ligase [Bdellovibrio sp.]|nr:MAG: isoleucine--tRNA ligase [Bdellovibrio sp.]
MPDYKSTLRLPQTDFPMKGNLPQREPSMLKNWKDKDIYRKMVHRNKGKQRFVFLDGPPYANGGIHMGHALNKVLKDIIIKYRNMTGQWTPFVPGWDCHGLPIEHGVMKELGDKAKEKSDLEILSLCRAEAGKWVKLQNEQFQRLGILADWENPYITMDADYEAEEIREFARAYAKGAIYLGTKPVYWNWSLQTALAEAEVEYHMHKSPSIFVRFPVLDPGTLDRFPPTTKPLSVVIWTTTPWTLPANLGIAFHPEFNYGVFETDSEALVIATSLQKSFEKESGLRLRLRGEVTGAKLEGGFARHPFLERNSLFVLGEHVTRDSGTGAVHTAPGHGADDYKVGLKYGLPVLSPVGPDGTFTAEVPEFKGVHIFKANPLIIEKLRSLGRLVAAKEIEHSYPHCWRTKIPLIFRATPQWFIGLDHPESQIREKTLKALADIRFFPSWGEPRLRGMLENRPDWCLSRQRIWGVPIPIFYCKKTGKPLADTEVMMRVADLVERDGGIEAVAKHPPEYFIGSFKPRAEDPDFGSEGFAFGKDILDVWFDSGIAHAAVQKKKMGLPLPADIYLEGSDQHRGWFNTSLLSSMVTNGKPPFKALITHGFINDAQGFKMSKSKGNKVDPAEICEKSGAEILRLWCIYEDYGQDLTYGPELFERVTETYRRIRNTMRFLLGSLNDFDPAKDSVGYADLTLVDQWALARLADLIVKVGTSYREFSFYRVYHALNSYFTVDLSAIYLDLLKDRLYTWKVEGKPRRSAQTVLHHITENLVRLMAPVLSFLSEEVYGYLKDPKVGGGAQVGASGTSADPSVGKKAESVFLLDFPVPPKPWERPELSEQFAKLLEVRGSVQKALEEMRAQKLVGSSLEAQLSLTCEGEVYQTFQKIAQQGPYYLREFFIVSQVHLKQGPLQVQVQKAEGEKCVRCWTYSPDTNKNSQFPKICGKCVEALNVGVK